MGWLRRDRNGPEGFYTGDAPVSAPGLGNSDPTAYGQTPYVAAPFGAEPTPGSDTTSAYGNTGAAGPPVDPGVAAAPTSAGWNAGPWNPGAPAPLPRRRGPWGGLLVLFVLLALVAGGAFYFLVGRSQEDQAGDPTTTTGPTSPSRHTTGTPTTGSTSAPTTDPGPPVPAVTPMKKPAMVSFRGNTYTVTVRSAQWQQAAAWNTTANSSKVGHLVVDLTLTRTDKAQTVGQISWFDWGFDPPKGKTVESELVGGAYGNSLKTLNLDPSQKVSGSLNFEIRATKGVLQLSDGGVVVGQWAVTAAEHPSAKGVLGKTVTTAAAQLPFSVKVSDPVWTPSGSENLGNDPSHGYILVLDAAYRSTRKADPAAETADYVDPTNWRFTPKKGRAQLGSWGQVNRDRVDRVEIWPGESAAGKMLLDVPGQPGVLSLIGRDGVPVISWSIPGPA
ncbi:hypothetical protein D1871_04050 [Nakamurella silvestris]|nr:hypothetical protein D1871_04050 [Nakamurella silvestris]